MSESLPLPPSQDHKNDNPAPISSELQGALAVAQFADRVDSRLHEARKYAEYCLGAGRHWSNELPRRMRENPKETWRAVGGVMASLALAGGVANCVNEIRESEPIECVTEVLQPGDTGIDLVESAAKRLANSHPKFDPHIDPRLAEAAGLNSKSQPGEKREMCLHKYPSPIDLVQPYYMTVE